MTSANNNAFSTSLLLERDQQILQKHNKEKRDLLSRIQKLKTSNDERAKELFDALHRGDRLARSIGFENLYKAQIFIDSCEGSTTGFKESVERVRILEAELACERKEVEILEVKLRKAGEQLNEEVNRLKKGLRETERAHQSELKHLQDRYDSLKAVKDRAAERYKSDYKKWRAFSKWIFAEHDKHQKHRNEPGISKEEKKRRDVESVLRKRRKMVEIGPDLARFEGEPSDDSEAPTGIFHPPPIGSTEPDADKENNPTTSSPFKKKSQSSFANKENNPTTSSPSKKKKSQSVSDRPASIITCPSRPLQELQLQLEDGTTLTTIASFPTTKQPGKNRSILSFQPILDLDPIHIKQEPDMTTPTNRPVKRRHMASSSDTEEDSQAVAFPSTNPRSGKPAVFKVPAPPSGSTTPSVVRPRSAPEVTNLSGIECSGDSARPSKVRRLSDDLNVFDWPQDENTPCTSKGKKKHEKPAVTPRNSGEDSRRLGDYSAYKGRGRYGGQIQNSEKTVNALFTIDPKCNDGKNYQYDEVVRNKEERRKMHAGDCECCREYYKNVGPLPNRLQQPLWRSPSRAPQPLDDSHGGTSDPARRQADIDARQQAISRHRQTWARAKTPPGYWEIGFPNTQEVGDINKKAREMQKKRMIEIENESNREGGRYRRK